MRINPWFSKRVDFYERASFELDSNEAFCVRAAHITRVFLKFCFVSKRRNCFAKRDGTRRDWLVATWDSTSKSKIWAKKWKIKISLRCWPIWPRFLWQRRSAVKFSFECCKNYPNPTTHIEDIFDFHLFFHRAYRFFPISKNKNGFGVDLSIGLHQKSYFWKRKNSPETGYQLKIAESWFWYFRAGNFREIWRCKISDFGSTTSPNRFFE